MLSKELTNPSKLKQSVGTLLYLSYIIQMYILPIINRARGATKNQGCQTQILLRVVKRQRKRAKSQGGKSVKLRNDDDIVENEDIAENEKPKAENEAQADADTNLNMDKEENVSSIEQNEKK